jgi:hypothetical protein
MNVIIGSAVGCLPLIWALNRRRQSVKLLGHSKDQISAVVGNGFEEINYHDHSKYFKFK